MTAPGGDSVYRNPAVAPNGRVLSTYPASRPCTRRVQEGAALYCYLQGTSMASPHAAGVAALIVSMFGHMPPGRVKAQLSQTADSQPCPMALPPNYAEFLRHGDAKRCVLCVPGRAGHNSRYGSGQVNALNAVMHTTGR